MQMQRIMGVIFAVIVVIVGLVMLPLVLNQTQTARSNANIDNFPGTQAIIDLIPLLYSVGVLGLAGTVAFFAIRSEPNQPGGAKPGLGGAPGGRNRGG